MPFLFENLDVYNQSMQLADELTNVTETFSKGKYYLKDQLNRAALSVPNNIAEGNGRFTKNDKTHFFHIARGSAFECVSILELCKRKKLISDAKNQEYKTRIDNVCRMISGLIKCQTQR